MNEDSVMQKAAPDVRETNALPAPRGGHFCLRVHVEVLTPDRRKMLPLRDAARQTKDSLQVHVEGQSTPDGQTKDSPS